MRLTTLLGLAALATATSATAAPTAATSPATQPPAAGAAAQGAATTTEAPAGAMAAPSSADASASVAVGQPVKDNTGVTIGKITKVNASPGGKQTAVIAMGADSFAVDTSALAVQNGAAVINASQTEIKGMLAKSK